MYIGIDVGGTNLKAGLVDTSGQILAVVRTPLHFQSAEALAETLASLALDAVEKAGQTVSAVESVGIGIPGAVSDGTVLYTANIPMRDVPLEKLFRRHLDLPVFLGNDADCAAVGEYLLGAGKGTRDFLVITLGTGIGGGLILGGKLQSGMGCGGEVGHMVIERNGIPCSCGRRGCWEAYASATGLVRMAQEAMKAHPESLLHPLSQPSGLEGRTVFEAAEAGDPTALELCDTYVSYLAEGLTNLINILHPEVAAIGGGIAAAPEKFLLSPLREFIKQNCFGRHAGRVPEIVTAALGNHAGIVGAALLQRVL